MQKPTESLTSEAVLNGLVTLDIPHQVLCFAETGSTMEIAREQLKQQPESAFPMLILADSQTAGRGRLGRPWIAPPGSALLFSLVLRPRWMPPSDVIALVWMTGVSVCEAIAGLTPLHPRLKWPNDVLLVTDDGQTPPTPKKIAGILMEFGSTGEQVDWAIVGCGLNVSASPPEDTPLNYPATSLAEASGQPVPRLPLLQSILTRLDYWYIRLQQRQRDHLFATWRDTLATLGQQVQLHTTEGTLSGLAEEVAPSGALLVRDADGVLHTVTSGDVGG